MAREENLKSFGELSKEKRKEIAKMGGKASAQKRAERKVLKDELLALLSENDTQKKISLALINQAERGNYKAFIAIRDTIGEKPIDKTAIATGNTIEEALKRVEGDEY